MGAPILRRVIAMPDNKPRVSVITACRNSARTIERTILSVANQTYGRVEHIIVDADSSDGTGEIIGRHRQHVSQWIREPDEGIADAWNKGIRSASGDLIGIINADDHYMPDAIARAVETFFLDNACGFVFGDLRVTNETTGKWHIEKGRQEYERVTRYDMLHLPHPTVFVRNAIYRQVGFFDSQYRIAADYEFIRRMVAKGIRGTYIPQVLAVMSQGGVSDTQRIAAFREVRSISRRYGCNPLLAGSLFWFKFARTYLGRMMDVLGVDAAMRRRVRGLVLGLPERKQGGLA